MNGRGNGLGASSWAPIADLDTLLVAPVLEELRQRGIAAYAEPSHGTQGAYLEVRWHDRPTDRLFVDSNSAPAARSALESTLPSLRADLESTLSSTAGPGSPTAAANPAATDAAPHDDLPPTGGPVTGPHRSPEDRDAPAARSEDEVWAELVAGFNSTPEGLPPWPVQEDLAADSGSRPDQAGDGPPATGLLHRESGSPRRGQGGYTARGPRRSPFGPLGSPGPAGAQGSPGSQGSAGPPRAAGSPRGAESAGSGSSGSTGWDGLTGPPRPDPTDHYVPPEPPPLPRADTITRLAWCGVIGAPLLVLVIALFREVLPTSVALIPVLAFVAGFVTLVARMRERPSDLDGPDDGAVV